MLPIDPLEIPDFVRLVDRGNDQIADTVKHPTCWDFEEPLPAVMATLAQHSDGAFFDVGANTGFYSVLVGKAGPGTTVRSFEPVPEIAAMCRENLALNRVDAEVLEIALSDRAGEASIHFPSDEHGLIETSASLNPDFKPTVTSRLVPTDTLDAVAGERRVGLIKIDVEAFEHVVLRGARETLRRDRPWVVVEVLPIADTGSLNAVVAEFDYVPFVLQPGMKVTRREQVAFEPESWNQLLVPSEGVAAVTGLLAESARRYEALRSRPAGVWGQAQTVADVLALQAAVERDVRMREFAMRGRPEGSWWRRLRNRARG